MADVVVGHPFDVAQAHRQHRLGALERLALALLVHAQHDCVLGRTQIQPHDIAQLLDEERIGGELEVLGAVRLQAQELEVAVHAGGRDRRLSGDRSHAPVRGAARRLGMQGLVDQLGHALVIDRARLAGPKFIVKPIEPVLEVASAPLAHRGASQLQPLGDRAVGLARGRCQHDARSRYQRGRDRPRARHGRQLDPLRLAQHQIRLRTTPRHVDISAPTIPTNGAKNMTRINGTEH